MGMHPLKWSGMEIQIEICSQGKMDREAGGVSNDPSLGGIAINDPSFIRKSGGNIVNIENSGRKVFVFGLGKHEGQDADKAIADLRKIFSEMFEMGELVNIEIP